MNRFRSRKTLAVAAAAFALVAGGGAAIAASQGSAPTPKSFFDAVAKHLGISSQKLQDATKAAAIDQVDAAFEAGKITKAEADALKARINSGEYPPFFGPFFGPPGHFHGDHHFFGENLSAAAGYLGLTEEQLRTQLESGKSLAAIAEARGKSVDGLKTAIVDGAKANLDQAVKDGELTQAQADDMLARLKSHVDDLVNGTLPRWRDRDHRGFGPPPGPLGQPSI